MKLDRDSDRKQPCVRTTQGAKTVEKQKTKTNCYSIINTKQVQFGLRVVPEERH